MEFIHLSRPECGEKEEISFLAKALSEGPVLWLISGGSNIPIEVNVLNHLEQKLTGRLNILLADERYGPKGHKDSNYSQLMAAGLKLGQANFPDILASNLPPAATLKHFSQTFEKLRNRSKVTVSHLGIGEDGHLAGVLPYSPAVETDELIVYYEAPPYKRLTPSLNTLKAIDKTYVFCFGDNKRSALTRLKEGQESLESLPSLILKQMTDVTVYNDQL